MKQEMMRWQQHQLDHMQVMCTLLQRDNHASTPSLNFYMTDALPAGHPTNSIEAFIVGKLNRREYIYEKIVALHHCLD